MLIPIGFLAASGAGAAGSYDLLATTILSSSQASVTFNSLSTYASTYQHLQIRYAARSDRSSFALDDITIQFNGDSGNNYSSHLLYGSGSGVASLSATSQSSTTWAVAAGSTASANAFAAGVIDLLDAFEITKYKTIRQFSGAPAGGENQVRLASGLWQSTSAITSIVLDQVTGPNFVAGSRFSLYGLRAS